MMRTFKIPKNPFLIFSPFLILFIVLVIKQHNNLMEGDESGYIGFAENLLHGFYSPPAPDINLWWGPGYPILLTPFIALRLPLIYITLLNAFFQYFSIVLLYKAISGFVDYQKAILFSLFWAFCYSSYQYIYVIYSEPFTVFLITLLIFSISKSFNTHLKKYLIVSGLILGYIALIKVIFGYVILVLLSGSILLLITKRNAQNHRKSALIFLIAFITTIPYLLYTYNLTGRLFYWGNSGGMSLYWMSTPYEREYGSWNNEFFTANHIDSDITGAIALLKLNHQKDIDQVKKFKGIQKDDEYKKIAIQNIRAHPVKYLKNIFSNISNMIFGFPNTYTYEHPLLKIWYFSILFSLMLFSLIPTVLNWKRMPYSIRLLLAITFIYLSGSSLLSVYNRQFLIIVPVLLFWIAYTLHRTITLTLNFKKSL